jgi:hypothetical protein
LKNNATIFFSSTDENYEKSKLFTGRYTAGSAYWILNRIIIAPSDFTKDLLMRQIDTFKLRRLSAVLVHEVVHIYIKERIGVFKTIFLPSWKNEGYCEFISDNSTIDIQYAKNIFLNMSKSEEDALFDRKDFHARIYGYFKHRIKVDYLLAYKKVDFDTFIENDYDEEVLENEIKRDLRSGTYKFENQ